MIIWDDKNDKMETQNIDIGKLRVKQLPVGIGHLWTTVICEQLSPVNNGHSLAYAILYSWPTVALYFK